MISDRSIHRTSCDREIVSTQEQTETELFTLAKRVHSWLPEPKANILATRWVEEQQDPTKIFGFLCETIKEDGITLSGHTYRMLARVGQKLQVDPKNWATINYYA